MTTLNRRICCHIVVGILLVVCFGAIVGMAGAFSNPASQVQNAQMAESVQTQSQQTLSSDDWDVTIDEASSTLEVEEGQTVFVTMAITNNGDSDGEGIARLVIEGTEVDDEMINEPPIAPGETREVTLEWETESGWADEYEAYAEFVVHDINGGGDYDQTTVVVTEPTEPAFNLESLDQEEYEVEVGETLDVEATVSNQGAGDEAIANVVLEIEGSEVANTQESITPGEQEDITVSYDISDRTDPGEYTAAIIVNDEQGSTHDGQKFPLTIHEQSADGDVRLATPISIGDDTFTVGVEFDGDQRPYIFFRHVTEAHGSIDVGDTEIGAGEVGGFERGEPLETHLFEDEEHFDRWTDGGADPLDSDSTVVQAAGDVEIDDPVTSIDDDFPVRLTFDGLDRLILFVELDQEMITETSDSTVTVSQGDIGRFTPGETIDAHIFEDERHLQEWREGQADPLASDSTTVQEAPDPNFEIQSVDYPSPPVALDDPAVVDVTVENTGGEGTQEVTLDVQFSGQFSEEVSLGAGESTTVTIQGEYDGGGDVTHEVFTDDDSTEREVPVGPRYVIDDYDYPSSVSVGDEFTLEATVTNENAPSDGKIVLGLSEDLDGEDHLIQETFEVHLGYQESETVSHTIDTAGEAPGEYELVVSTADDHGNSMEMHMDEVTLTPEDQDPAHFSVVIDDAPTSVEAGETVTVDATIENTGDMSDEQTIELVSSGGESLDEQPVSLGASESETVSFEWQTADEDVGSNTLVVESDDDSDSTTVEVDPPETDDPFFVVSIQDVTTPVQEGDTVAVEVAINNRGGEAGSQEIVLNARGVAQDSTTVDLGPDDTPATATLVWETEPGDAGDRSVEVVSEDTNDAELVAVESPEEEDDDAEPARFDVRILDVTDPVAVGESVTVDVEVTNDGDRSGSATIDLTALESVHDEVSVDLDDGETTTVQLTWVTDDGDEGDHDVQVSGPDGADSTTVMVGQPYFELTIDAVDLVDSDHTVAVNVTVENTGPVAGTQQLVAIAEDAEQDSQELTLSPGDSEVVSFSWSGDESALGQYGIEVESEDTSDTTIESFDIGDAPAGDEDDEDDGGSSTVRIGGILAFVGLILGAYFYSRMRSRSTTQPGDIGLEHEGGDGDGGDRGPNE